MTLRDALKQTKVLEIPEKGRPVNETAAKELHAITPQAQIRTAVSSSQPAGQGVLRLWIADQLLGPLPHGVPQEKDWLFISVDESGGGELVASRPHLLYGLICRIAEEWLDRPLQEFTERRLPVTFKWQRPVFDTFLTQVARTLRNLDRRRYIREYARLGYSHIEVNGLASPLAHETGLPEEVYPRFYTYCPALDQYVESELNRGTYPAEYLQANLNFLKRNAALAIEYGLTPGLLCFEPRSVPDSLLERYPLLRGARVDHPFRSAKPRYNLTLAHPVVRSHYAEMMTRLLEEVPELGYIAIWTNDSGAGFEYTNTLYVGRNGGAYLIREWKDHSEIARAASENVLRFFQTLRDAARKINPEFRVITRLEPFSDERPFIWEGLGDGIDVETPSLLGKGWEIPYTHPRYKDITGIATTAYHHRFDAKEREKLDELERRGSHAHIMHAHSHMNVFDPLIGIPYPWLTHEKLRDLAEVGVSHLAHMGGVFPPTHAPWCINQEVWKAVQFDGVIDIDKVVEQVAERWAGAHAGELVRAWRHAEEAIRAFPIPTLLYAIYGFTWMRLWVRPLVPNIEALSEEERAYYETFLLSPPHNPNRVDLRWDVLFDLATPEHCLKAVQRMDENLAAPMDAAVNTLQEALASMSDDDPARPVFVDQADRLRALRCWFRTQRSVAAWIAGVHGYLESTDPGTKAERRRLVRDMVLAEIDNTRDLLDLWETSQTEFMIISGVGETSFVHGENFGDLLRRRIEVMKGREDDEPYIDPDFMWRVSSYGLYDHAEGKA